MTDNPNKRLDHDAPLAIAAWGWRYHHLGIPVSQPVPGEQYLPHLKISVSGFDQSPFGIEWMRFDDDCPIHELIKRIPHVAFEVDDIDLELDRHDFHVITKPNSPGEGIRVAMIEHNGAPVELIEFGGKIKPGTEN
jgi:hypothetical protein